MMACGALVFLIQWFLGVSALAQARWESFDVDLFRAVIVSGCNLTLVILCLVAFRAPDLVRSTWLGWLAAAVATTALLAAGGLVAPSSLSASALLMLPANALQAVQLVAVVFITSPRVASAMVLISVPLAIGLRHASAGLTVLDGLDESMLETGTSLVVIVVLYYLRVGADAADRLAIASRAEAEAQAERVNADLARENARRIIHDDVISALRVIELGLGPAEVRSACELAIKSVDGGRPVTSVDDLRREVEHVAPVEVRFDSTEWIDSPPPRVLSALRGAAAEAVRNAWRHGHATTVDVVMQSDGTHVRVVITDDGEGLAPDWSMGFGVRESIVGRMAEIGGTGSIEAVSHPEHGAQVCLTWPEVADSAERTAEVVVPDRRRVLSLVGMVCGSTTIYTAVRFPALSPAVGWTVAAAVLGTLVVVVHGLTRRQVNGVFTSRRALTALGVWLCALIWVGLLAAGDGALLSLRSWIVGSASNVVALVAFDARARRIALVVAAQVATVALFAVHDPTVGLLEPVGALVTPIVVGGMGAVLGTALRHGEGLIASRRAELEAMAEAEIWSRVDAAVRRRQLAHLHDDVVPFVTRAAADGAAAPTFARLLAAGCRDGLYLEPPLDADTRAAVREARRRGVDVTLRPGRHDPAAAWPVLRSVLQEMDPTRTITVLPAGAQAPGRIVVTPGFAGDVCKVPGQHEPTRSTFALPRPLSAKAVTDDPDAGAIEVGS